MARSVTDIADQAERERQRAAREAARATPLPLETIVEGLSRQIDSKIWWLEKHGAPGSRWSASDIQQKRTQLAVLVQAYDIIRGGSGNDPTPR